MNKILEFMLLIHFADYMPIDSSAVYLLRFSFESELRMSIGYSYPKYLEVASEVYCYITSPYENYMLSRRAENLKIQ